MEASAFVSHNYNGTTVPVTLSAMLGMQAACLCLKRKIYVQYISTVGFPALNESSEMEVLQVNGLFQKYKYSFIMMSGGMVSSWLDSALDSGASGLGLSPDWGHCIVFLGKTP